MADVDADPHILGQGLLPTPFSAGEIRAGCREGRFIRLLVEVDGQQPVHRTNQFVDVDADGATLESQMLTIDGRPISEIDAKRTTWHQLQAHAAFEASTTTRSMETIETPLGVNDCIRYVHVEGAEMSTYWFAPSSPGMPIRYETEEGGRVTSRVTMIENVRP